MENFCIKSSEWLKAEGNHHDLVISSRIRLARNLDNIVFTHLADSSLLNKINSIVKEAIKGIELLEDGLIIELVSMNNLYKKVLVEKHLISNELLRSKYGLVILDKKENISIMVNEEDHLRLQAFANGLNFKKAWEVISLIDNSLSERLDYAYSPRLGYLTACPTNVGTGLRASVLIHLPALCISDQINKLLKEVVKLGIVIRGLYGEGTQSKGNLFQLSNQVTLGQTEEEFIDNVEKIALQIIDYERNAQETLKNTAKYKLEDRIYRAYGILKHARLISSNEALELLSLVRLGVNLGFLSKDELSYSKLNELLIYIQPAHVQVRGSELEVSGKFSGFEERDYKRAQLIRSYLEKL